MQIQHKNIWEVNFCFPNYISISQPIVDPIRKLESIRKMTLHLIIRAS